MNKSRENLEDILPASIWSKADIHLHTTYSNGLMTPEELVNYVIGKTDLRVIAITDHDTIEGGLIAQDYLSQNRHCHSGLEVVVGAEITSAEGHILGLFLNHDVPTMMSAEETIGAIHAEGGIAVAAHPHAHWLKWLGMKGVGNAICCLPLDAIETLNATPTEVYANWLAQWVNRFGQCLPETGGSDAYCTFMVGKAYTLFEGDSATDLHQALSCGKVKARGFVYNPFIALIYKMLVYRRLK